MRKSTKVIKPETDIRYKEIMQIAARIIARQGYQGTTIEDIASELGLTPAAIYYYFRSKADLLHHIAVDLPEPIDKILKVNENHLSPGEQLRQVISQMITLHTQYPEFSVISSESRRFLPEEASEIILKRHKQVHQVIQDTLEKGVEEGIFAVEDIQMASFALLGACNWVYRWYKPNGRLKPAEIAARFVSFLEKGYLNTESRLPGYVIHSGNEEVYPSEVEEVLLQHPTVKEALVMAVPDPYWQERVHAIVVLKEGGSVTDSELVSYCKTRLIPAKVPKSLEFRDSLPGDLSREEARVKLSEKYWQGLKRRV